MSAHMHYIKNAVLKSSAVLKHNLEESNAAGEDEQDPITTDLRELIINFDHTPTMVRRVYLQTSDSSSLTSVGWVINEHIGFCMSCQKSFTLFNRRHHCRACGLLLCSECTPSSSLLQEFEDLGVQRVCGKCNPKFEKVVKLENNIAWGRSVNAPHEVHHEGETPSSNPITETADQLEASEAIAHREAAIAQMRQEEDRQRTADAVAALTALPLTIKVIPFPGFVIKTRRVVMDDNKVFINVFHHTSLPDEFMMLTYTPFIPKTTATSPASVVDAGSSPREAANAAENALNGTVSLPTVGERMTPIVYCGAPSSTEDKEGYVSLLYNVLVSSAYFERTTVQGQEVQITHPTSVNKIIQMVNQQFKESLCEDNFVLPKVKSRYHGAPITKPIPFTKADFAVSHVETKYLYCTGFQPKGDDESSVGGRLVTTAQLHAAAAQANATNKVKRFSSGRVVSGATSPSGAGTGNEDAESMVSDLTLASNLTESQQGFVRENRRFSFYASKKVEGAEVVNEEMLRLNARKTMSGAYSDTIKESSIADPAVLIGYQIVMPYNKEIEAQFSKGSQLPLVDRSFIYVIVDLAKNNLRKTEYKVTNLTSGDSWVRLQRGKGKSGIEFRVLRKVYFPPEKDKDAAAKKLEAVAETPE